MMCRLSQQAVDDILLQGRIFEVGGAVRDRLLSVDKEVKDRDYLVTGIDYDKLTGILKRHGRVDLVGKSFGVIKFTERKKSGSFTFDITLPRKEFSTGAGHREFKVNYDPALPVQEDLTRRDFTINAMALSLDNNELIDPLDGQVDIEKRQIRMTSEQSFDEDPLRMLRAVQFAARFEFSIESNTLQAMNEKAKLIGTVSSERVAEELNKLLVLSPKPSIGFRLMQETGLLAEILPELEECVDIDQPGGYHKYNVFVHTLHAIDAVPAKLRLRLAALFHDIRKPQCKRLVEKGATFYNHEVKGAKTARSVLKRLRYSNDLIDQVDILVTRHMFTTQVSDKGMRRLVHRVGKELIFDLLELRRADVIAQGMGGTTEDVDEFEARIQREFDNKAPFGLNDLAIDGKEIMALLSITEGPLIGKVLEQLLDSVLDDPSVNNKDELSQLALEYGSKMTSEHKNGTDKEETA